MHIYRKSSLLLHKTSCLLQTGEAADVEKYSKRTIRVTQAHNDECKKLLRLMGVPVVEVGVSLSHAVWCMQLCGIYRGNIHQSGMIYISFGICYHLVPCSTCCYTIMHLQKIDWYA